MRRHPHLISFLPFSGKCNVNHNTLILRNKIDGKMAWFLSVCVHHLTSSQPSGIPSTSFIHPSIHYPTHSLYSVHPFVFLYILLFTNQSLSVHQSLSQSSSLCTVCVVQSVFICVSATYLFVSLSVSLSVSLCICLCLSVFLSTYLSIHLSIRT